MDEDITPTVYYLPGRGGKLTTGLGKGLLDRGFSVLGRETRDAFLKLTFQQQLDTIKMDLLEQFWHKDSKLVAVSYGCYLFLHTQLSSTAFPGKILLLSPVLYGAFSPTVGIGYISSTANKLRQAVEEHQFPSLKQAEIHVGLDDSVSNPEEITAFGEATSIPVTTISGKGHMLGEDYVGPLLDRWLAKAT